MHLPDELAARLAAAAARRGVPIDEIATELVEAGLSEHDEEPNAPAKAGRRLAFAGIGASTSNRAAAEADDMLAEGFGRS